jgi:thiol-disulfide isomerase/thioredoxin
MAFGIKAAFNSGNRMSDQANHDRRHFLGGAAMTLVAAKMGILGAKADAAAASRLPVEGNLPSFDGGLGWLNSQPLTASGLRGKVALIDFWTYTCINWRRQLPYVRAWAEEYKTHGLVTIGVHTPEFPFEKNTENVRRATKETRVDYPVVIDSDYAIWRAFDNEYWPALYFVDGQGRIRHHVFGEGEYDKSERVLQQLLAEVGATGFRSDLVSVHADGPEAAPDWANLGSGENYVGYQRTEDFESLGGPVRDKPHVYSAPPGLKINHWALSGNWTMQQGAITINQPNGRIAYKFHARDLHLVMGPGAHGNPVRFRVFIDGQQAATSHGSDVDAQGNGTVSQPRMYQLIRQSSPIVDRQFEIQFLDAGVEAFSFTFG